MHRRDDAQRVSQTHRKRICAGAALPTHYGGRAIGRRRRSKFSRACAIATRPITRCKSPMRRSRRREAQRQVYHRSLPSRQSRRFNRRSQLTRTPQAMLPPPAIREADSQLRKLIAEKKRSSRTESSTKQRASEIVKRSCVWRKANLEQQTARSQSCQRPAFSR